MFHHLNSYFSGSVPTLIAVVAGLGVGLYFIFRYWQNIAILSRNRSQLLSVSAVLLVVGVWQIYQLSWARGTDQEFFSLVNATPRPRALTIESLFAAGLPVVPTYHNDNSRTGQNTLETQLTPDNVNFGHFGKLYSFPVDGYVYAQPLYAPQIAIPGNGIHNVVIVATQHDSVYAFDSDSPTPEPLWRVNF